MMKCSRKVDSKKKKRKKKKLDHPEQSWVNDHRTINILLKYSVVNDKTTFPFKVRENTDESCFCEIPLDVKY